MGGMWIGRVVFWELVLVLASVLIFRSGWHLLDRLGLMDLDSVLWLSLIVGMVLASLSLFKLNNGR